METFSKRRRQFVLTMLLLLAGCSKEISPDLITTAESALESARSAMEAKNYPEAIQHLDVALAKGGLMPDLYCGALMSRAECQARTGNFDQALADLELAERGAALDEVHALRSFVFNKQGRSAEAQQEMREAKSINPQVTQIAD